MKEIKLTQGKVALVDDADFEKVNQFKWFARNSKGIWYAMRFDYNAGKRVTVHLHHFIMDKPPKGFVIDHIDHSGLNNQRFNLRLCSVSENKSNRTASGKSKYLGVSIRKRKDGVLYYISEIAHNKQRKYLGRFLDEVEAAKAYDKAAIQLKGKFANLNFPLNDKINA